MNLTEADPQLEALLHYLRQNRGFDFTGYKRSSLTRRIERRMQSIGIGNYVDYLDHLEVDPDEFVKLFNTILINVTSFFRDLPVWECLAEEIVPRILVAKAPEEPIRAWSAGCATGEEPYSLAILLAEALGIEQYRERVKIYATDVDEEALAKARPGAYWPRDVHGVSAERLERFFEPLGGRYHFHRELRRSVVFGRHDLMSDAPISRIDLLACRNTLMYFNADAQARILTRFHFALSDNGCLILGKAETLLSHGSTFMPVDLKRRIFAKVRRPKLNPAARQMLVDEVGSIDAMDHQVSQGHLRDSAFDEGPVAQIVVDVNGAVALANERARQLFGLTPREIGRPLQDLELSYRPVELRSCIEQAYQERRPVVRKEVEWPNRPGRPICVDVLVTSLLADDGTSLGVTIAFDDVTAFKRLQEEVKKSQEELETAYEELQSTNEELETTNEELQSTIEELETTNEELQSTNEELETMNEELQSTNEELQTINDELHQRSDELNQSNLFLEAILTSMRAGVAVLDRDLRVLIWNRKAEDQWGLRPSEVVGQHFLNLDIGLPVELLSRPLRNCLAGEINDAHLTMAATNRRGKPMQCRVTCTPVTAAPGEARGIILLMEEATE